MVTRVVMINTTSQMQSRVEMARKCRLEVSCSVFINFGNLLIMNTDSGDFSLFAREVTQNPVSVTRRC